MDEAGEGEGKWSLEVILKIVFLSVAILVVVLLTTMLIIGNFSTENLEMNIFFNRLVYSKNTISYHDIDTGRTYLGIIDIDKLTEKNLNNSMIFNGTMYGAKITVGNQKPVYYRENVYKSLEPLAIATPGGKKIEGPGGADYLKRIFDAGVMQNGQIERKTITMEIVKSRT